jgi:GYF domain 2
MASEWFCRIMGEEWGPMSAQELIAVAQRGRLTRDDFVKQGAKGTWVRAELVRGLFNTPPVAPTVTSDRLIAAVQRAAPAQRSTTPTDPLNYWIKIQPVGKRVAGPFSARHIRQFAELGVLKPFHLVSNDRRHWSRAVHVPGLVFGRPGAAEKPASIRSAVWIDEPLVAANCPTINTADRNNIYEVPIQLSGEVLRWEAQAS